MTGARVRRRRSALCDQGQHHRCADGAAIGCHCPCHIAARITTINAEPARTVHARTGP